MRADENGDGALTEAELNMATFIAYDANEDEMLDEDEMGMFEADEQSDQPFASTDALRGTVSQ